MKKDTQPAASPTQRDLFTIPNPFTILVDSMEQQPFTFENIRADRSQGEGLLHIPTKWKALGIRHSRDNYEPRGDYSIDGLEGFVHVERKGLGDAHNTILSYGDREKRFIRELENLATMPFACVVIEASLGELIKQAPSWGKRSARENAKVLHRRVISWTQDHGVQWLFCDTRRLAEITTFRFLARAYREHHERKKREVAAVKNAARAKEFFL